MSFDPITYAMAKAYSDSKGGYTKTETKVLASYTDAEFVENEGGGITFFPPSVIPLTGGAAYTVEWDGVKYECIAQVDEDMVYLGNIEMVEDGEPFTVVTFPTDSMVAATQGNTHSFTISQTVETIHPIKPEYLPGVCLPVVEIADLTSITAEENAKLTACIGMPIVCRFNQNGVSILMSYTHFDSHAFAGQIGELSAIIGSEDGVTWALTDA